MLLAQIDYNYLNLYFLFAEMDQILFTQKKCNYKTRLLTNTKNT